MSAPSQREAAISQGAVALSAEQRAACLGAACQNDGVRRQRLAAREQPDALLATQGKNARPTIKFELPDKPAEEVVGLTFGRYQSCWSEGAKAAAAWSRPPCQRSQSTD